MARLLNGAALTRVIHGTNVEFRSVTVLAQYTTSSLVLQSYIHGHGLTFLCNRD